MTPPAYIDPPLTLLVRRHDATFTPQHLVDNVMTMLRSMERYRAGLQVSYLEHSIQTATRAYRANAQDDLVAAALLHDIGDVLAPTNHGEVAGAIVAPFLDEEATWIVRHHPVFQGYHFWDKLDQDRDAREQFRSSPHFDATSQFCAEWDQRSFDPAYNSMALEDFEPLLRDLLRRAAGRRS